MAGTQNRYMALWLIAVTNDQSVQNLLSSHQVSRNIKIKIRKAIILLVVLYGCETSISHGSHLLQEKGSVCSSCSPPQGAKGFLYLYGRGFHHSWDSIVWLNGRMGGVLVTSECKKSCYSCYTLLTCGGLPVKKLLQPGWGAMGGFTPPTWLEYAVPVVTVCYLRSELRVSCLEIRKWYLICIFILQCISS
jgi:hypothetical protein